MPQFIAIARLNRPIGILLLLWPTLWGLWFAAGGWPGWHLFLVFVAGVVLTRSAGCVINDIADRGFDGEVKRTRDRPLATGMIRVEEAVLFTGGLAFIALLLVLSTNLLTVSLAFLAAIVAGVYPLMKRYTYMPQIVLGVAFSFGIPMAYAAHGNTVPPLAWLLVVANVVWTVAYDTEYAMVDRDDDIRLGLKSSAILFADMDKLIIGVLQALFLFILYLAGRQIEATWLYHAGLLAAAGLLAYQQYLIRRRSREGCFTAFLNNHWVGLVIFAGMALHFSFS
ncbi:MAG: 4-hydroxybenzoate octaprenyltransferase [Pseudomonadales bacterium]